jgi:nucleoside-diphosphate-sugar epimerase
MRQDTVVRQRLLATREGHAVRQVVERLLPRLASHARSTLRSAKAIPGGAPEDESAPAPLRPWVVHYLAKRFRVRIDKARDVLGYRPVFRLEDGMRLTEQWARWTGLLS